MDLSMSTLKGKAITIVGLKGSGKTVFLKHLLNAFPKHLIVDPMLEYKGYRRYIPQNRSYSDGAVEEIDMVASMLVVPSKGSKAKVDFFAVDEANRYFPSRHPLPPTIQDINDLQRHWDLTSAFIARRPTQINTDIVELSNYIIVYNLAGKNDIQYLNDLSNGLGDAVLQMPKYHFMFVDERRQYKMLSPVPMVEPKKRGKEVHKDELDEKSGRLDS